MENDKNMLLGTVIWFKKGYGFARPDNGGADIFIHYSDIVMPETGMYRTLQKDQRVSYELGTNLRGQPKAISVQVLKHDTK